MKKISLLFVILIILGVCNAYAIDNEGTFGDCTWKFEKGVLTFDGTGLMPLQLHPYDRYEDQEKFQKSVKTIVIGENISGIESWEFFSWYPSLTKVVIGIDYINSYCTATKIKEVVYTSKNPFVMGWNFCSSRLEKITFEDPDVDYIQERNILYNRDKTELFYYLGSKSENVIVPEGVKIIRSGAFAQSKIKSISLPSTLEKIEKDAFNTCKNLKEITIPASCKEIGTGAFCGCINLQKVEFLGDTIKLYTTTGKGEHIEPDEQGAQFLGCKALKEIALPSCDTIPDQLFYMCAKLVKVTFGEGTRKIGHDVFYECNKLKNVYFPDNVDFDKGLFYLLKDVKIKCHEGSHVQELAEKYGVKYEIVE